jgi:hypothetical protein
MDFDGIADILGWIVLSIAIIALTVGIGVGVLMMSFFG